MRPSPQASTGVIAAFVRHRNAANLFMILFVLFGWWGLENLNRQLMPNTETRSVQVSVSWPGATAEDVERTYIDILTAVKASVGIPVAVKVGPFFSNFANMALR